MTSRAGVQREAMPQYWVVDADHPVPGRTRQQRLTSKERRTPRRKVRRNRVPKIEDFLTVCD